MSLYFDSPQVALHLGEAQSDAPERAVMNYATFLAEKELRHASTGREPIPINEILFPFQSAIVHWAVKKGRAAVFADTGLGKTFMQVEWARSLGGDSLIIAPLSVAKQTVREAAKLGVTVAYCRSGSDVQRGINITNYEMVEHFDAAVFQSVVLDESSILKSLDGKTRLRLTDLFADTSYRLCCTATPAPNDITEIANHAEFLGVMKRADMLASFFVHDDDGWRLKGHAEAAFYRWMASWGMSIKKPSDLGFSDDGFALSAMTVYPHFVESEYAPEGMLFRTSLKGISDRLGARRASIAQRVEQVAALTDNGEQWIVWCGLNEEGRTLKKLLPDSVLLEGNQSPDEKQDRIERFQSGEHRILITKSKITGFGLNFQNCHNMAFLGLSDSWEQYYQSVRRCWRFGQTEPVTVHIVLSEAEMDVYENVLKKEEQAKVMSQKLIEHVKDYERSELKGSEGEWEYKEGEASGKDWRLLLGDSTERLKEIESESVGLSVFSPPFLSLYTYSPSGRDVGNSRTENEFYTHFGYIMDELLRVTQPGRNCCVHVSQVPAMLSRDGYIGMKDFRGSTIQAFIDHGWIYHGEVCIDKDPQAQAIRTKSKSLLFAQLRKDASWLRPALADYILVFRKPGDNTEPILPDISNEEWIQWARPIWYGIRESDTLQYRSARSDDDERHIAPLQLGTIERCIRLWSNKGDLVLSPFTGIGSEGYTAIKHGRRFVGIELKPEYFKVAVKNLREIEEMAKTPDLFAWAEGEQDMAVERNRQLGLV